MTDPDEPRTRPTHASKKRAVAIYEALAHELAEMPVRQYAQLAVPELLRDEVERARATRGMSSRKRQAKFLAGFLRRYPEQALLLRDQLERLQISHRADQVLFHELEALRDRLCQPDQFDSALQDVRTDFPALDLDPLTRLAQRAHRSGDRRWRREIFRLLREAQVRRVSGADAS